MKIISNAHLEPVAVNVRSNTIEIVDHYIHVVDYPGPTSIKRSRIIQFGWAAFGRLQYILIENTTNGGLSVRVEVKGQSLCSTVDDFRLMMIMTMKPPLVNCYRSD